MISSRDLPFNNLEHVGFQTPLEARERSFQHHIIICFLKSNDQSHDFSIGLCNFIMPLRFHQIAGEDLKDIVVVGDRRFIAKYEWTSLTNFPNVFVIDVSLTFLETLDKIFF